MTVIEIFAVRAWNWLRMTQAYRPCRPLWAEREKRVPLPNIFSSAFWVDGPCWCWFVLESEGVSIGVIDEEDPTFHIWIGYYSKSFKKRFKKKYLKRCWFDTNWFSNGRLFGLRPNRPHRPGSWLARAGRWELVHLRAQKSNRGPVMEILFLLLEWLEGALLPLSKVPQHPLEYFQCSRIIILK